METHWTKMRASLINDPKVIQMATHLMGEPLFIEWWVGRARINPKNLLEITTSVTVRYAIVTGLLSLWSHAAVTSRDGFLPGMLLGELDEMAGMDGLGEALAMVGWAEEQENPPGVILHDFLRYNVCYKQRSPGKTGAERSRLWRQRKRAKECVTDSVTKTQQRVTRRIDLEIDKKSHPPPTPPLEKEAAAEGEKSKSLKEEFIDFFVSLSNPNRIVVGEFVDAIQTRELLPKDLNGWKRLLEQSKLRPDIRFPELFVRSLLIKFTRVDEAAVPWYVDEGGITISIKHLVDKFAEGT